MRHNHFTVKQVHFIELTHTGITLTLTGRDEVLQPHDAGEEREREYKAALLI